MKSKLKLMKHEKECLLKQLREAHSEAERANKSYEKTREDARELEKVVKLLEKKLYSEKERLSDIRRSLGKKEQKEKEKGEQNSKFA